jgi:general secretion pathway protein A
MLSNFQTDDKCLLQTFLVGQPEFRTTLHSPGMQQLRQRVIASYHLGPMDEAETKAYIEHRLATVGWQGDPSFTNPAHTAIFNYTGGIPRKVNTLCDRLLLMGFLEEIHAFAEEDVAEVIRDINQEFEVPSAQADMQGAAGAPLAMHAPEAPPSADNSPLLDERMMRLEKSVVSVLNILKKIVATPAGANTPLNHNNE